MRPMLKQSRFVKQLAGVYHTGANVSNVGAGVLTGIAQQIANQKMAVGTRKHKGISLGQRNWDQVREGSQDFLLPIF